MDNSEKLFYLSLRRLGYFRVIYASVIQLNTTIFRVIVGVLASIRPDALPIMSMIESILNTSLEVPGGYFADRFGRVGSSIIGFSLVAIAMLCIFGAILFSHFPQISFILLCLTGVLLGLGRPFFSGSVEAFYQSKIDYFAAEHPERKMLAQRSFTLAMKYGRFIPLIVVGFSFWLVWLLNKSNLSHYGLLLSLMLWIYLIFRISKDRKDFGGEKIEIQKQSPWQDAKLVFYTILHNRRAQAALVLNTLCFLIIMIVMGYQIVSLGRDFSEKHPVSFWWILISFAAGHFSLGWYLRSHLLPYCIQKWSPQKYLLVFMSFFLSINLLAYFFLNQFEWSLQIVFIYFYAALYQVCLSAIADLTLNLALESYPKSLLASALSVQNIPGLILDIAYSWYLIRFTSGVPTTQETLFTTSVFLILSLITLFIFWNSLNPVNEKN